MAEQLHYLAEGDPLIVIGIDRYKESLNLLFTHDLESLHQLAESGLVHHSIVVTVYFSVFPNEAREELFMLTELEVQHRLQELCKL